MRRKPIGELHREAIDLALAGAGKMIEKNAVLAQAFAGKAPPLFIKFLQSW
jgi:hypothetical protein